MNDLIKRWPGLDAIGVCGKCSRLIDDFFIIASSPLPEGTAASKDDQLLRKLADRPAISRGLASRPEGGVRAAIEGAGTAHRVLAAAPLTPTATLWRRWRSPIPPLA